MSEGGAASYSKAGSNFEFGTGVAVALSWGKTLGPWKSKYVMDPETYTHRLLTFRCECKRQGATTFQNDSKLQSFAYANYEALNNLPKYVQDLCLYDRLSRCHKSAARTKEYNLNGIRVCKEVLKRLLGIGLSRYLRAQVGMQDKRSLPRPKSLGK